MYLHTHITNNTMNPMTIFEIRYTICMLTVIVQKILLCIMICCVSKNFENIAYKHISSSRIDTANHEMSIAEQIDTTDKSEQNTSSSQYAYQFIHAQKLYINNLYVKLQHSTHNLYQKIQFEKQLLQRQYQIIRTSYKISRIIATKERKFKMILGIGVGIVMMLAICVFRAKIADGLIYILAPMSTYTNDTYPFRSNNEKPRMTLRRRVVSITEPERESNDT